MKIFLIVLAVIVVIIALFMTFSLQICVSYIDSVPKIEVKYFLFKVFPISDKLASKLKGKKKIKKEDTEKKDDSLLEEPVKKKKSKKVSSNKKKKEKKKKNPAEIIETVLSVLELSVDDFKKSGKKVYIKDIYIYFLSCNEDACKCAVNYGVMNGIVYNSLALLSTIFTTDFESVSIGMRYNEPKNVYNFSFVVKVRLGTGAGLALKLLFNYGKTILKKSKEVA